MDLLKNIEPIQGMLIKVALVLLGGFIGGRIAKKIGLPNVTGYIVVGLFLGPSLGFMIDLFKPYKAPIVQSLELGLIPNTSFQGIVRPQDSRNLSFLSEIALAFIAFSIGVEFSAKSIKKMGKSVLNIALFEVGFALMGVFLLTFFIPKPSVMRNGYNPFLVENICLSLLLASLSAATAPAATLLVMKQYRAYGPVTKTVLPVTAIDDIMGIIVFGIIISIVQIVIPHHNSPTDNSPGIKVFMIMKPFLEIILSLTLGATLGLMLKYFFRKTKKDLEETQALSIAVIFLSMGICYFINHAFKNNIYGVSLSPLLTNMMIGAIVANFIKKPKMLFESVNSFTTPFFILFFTLAGASLDLNILKSSSIIVVITIVYMIGRGGGKYLGAFIGALVSKSPISVRKYAGLALLPQGGISIGLVLIVRSVLTSAHSRISEIITTVILLSVLVYEISGPLFAKMAITKAKEVNGLDRLQQFT